MSETVRIDRPVSLEWIVCNLGSSFLEDDQPDCLEPYEEEDVTLHFLGTGERNHYGVRDVKVKVMEGPRAGTWQRGQLPAMTVTSPTEGWLIITLPDGTVCKRYYLDDGVDHADWVVEGPS